MKPDSWMPWQIQRWRNSPRVLAMSLSAQGAYRNFLDVGWQHGGKVPNHPGAFQGFAICKSPREWKKICQEVLSMFQVSSDGEWLTNETLTEQWQLAASKMSRISEARSQAASKGLAKRYQNPRKDLTKSNTLPNHTLPNKEQELKPSPQKARRPISQKAQLAVATGENRNTRIKGMIFSVYKEQNTVDPPWGPGEGAQLKALFSATPGWHDGQLAQCLANMYASQGFAKGTRPREFLPRLPRYLNGPLNEFNREQGNGHKIPPPDRDKSQDMSHQEVMAYKEKRKAEGFSV